MANKMLIDATHPEETRVVVVRGSRVEDFDFEAASRKQLRGNIYLAKVTRVEPSLQAAFIDYGGNRHGFLAFSEIHPDYYQIPVADRQALLAAEAEEIAAAQEVADAEAATEEAEEEAENASAEARAAAEGSSDDDSRSSDDERHDDGDDEHGEENGEDSVESVGAEDALEEVPERRRAPMRQYKIQEVIKRRQVLLVQVVKEERGNKGAALTTYLSLAGRYSVIMPNTARGGGISRKITSVTDRKRLKQVVSDLEVPEGMGVILRTAGASRTRAEVKRDFEYLLRLWETVRELTLSSTAPSLVYEEGSLIKRSIRDLYNKDIDEISVAGDDGYREAKDFMRMLMPSHAKNVQPYKDNQPLFVRYGVEAQLDAMFSPQVTLKSGGYIVINQTEALVAIDVNSGRSTREHNIEDTALQTNLEAAEEVARQLRLRDLAGLIVIDFIDMEERRNVRNVERRVKDCLKNDRARIQVGRISHFGLLEMSRQRIRTGVLESSMEPCAYCHGTGRVRAPASVALHVLRSLEDSLLKGATHHLTVKTPTVAALYILNQKRAHLSELEHRFGLSINVLAQDHIPGNAHFVLERGEPVGERPAIERSVTPDSVRPEIAPEDEDIVDVEAVEVEDDEPVRDREAPQQETEEQSERKRRRRRRRRRGGERPEGADAAAAADDTNSGEAHGGEDDEEEDGTEPSEAGGGEREDNGNGKRRRRRGRRGGRRSRRGENGELHAEGAEGNGEAGAEANGNDQVDAEATEGAAFHPEHGQPEQAEDLPDEDLTESAPAEETAPATQMAEAPAEEAPAEDARAEVGPEPVAASVASEARRKPAKQQEETVETGPKRSGWWQRRTFF